jgi:hypothetical protein
VQTDRGAVGVFEGGRKPAPTVAPREPANRLIVAIDNDALPGGRGPGGTIRERFSRPVLVRRRADGSEIGHPLDLEWMGIAAGGGGLYVDTYVAWSGTHFLYPFHGLDPDSHNSDARLLPIDCRPQ